MHNVSIIPVSRLTAHHQTFRCEPFASVITARSCLARQEASRDRDPSNPHSGGWSRRVQFERCGACELGAQVAARLRGVKDADAPVGHRCSHEGCDALVVGFTARKGLRPLCPDHRARPIAATPETPTQETTTMHIEILETASPVEFCVARDCAHPRGRVRADTNPELVELCSEHRSRAHQKVRQGRASTYAEAVALLCGVEGQQDGEAERPSEAPAAKKASKASRKDSKAPVQPVAATAPTPVADAVLEHVARALRLVERLGGIERAERLAVALEGVA